jgi:DNA-directed RNA polymerase subunit K/omega
MSDTEMEDFGDAPEGEAGAGQADSFSLFGNEGWLSEGDEGLASGDEMFDSNNEEEMLARGHTESGCLVRTITDPARRMTSNMMSQFEVARVLTVRAEQISRHNDPFLPAGVAPCSQDPVQVAIQELNLGMNPLIIRRARTHEPTGKVVVEDWPVRDMIVPQSVADMPK